MENKKDLLYIVLIIVLFSGFVYTFLTNKELKEKINTIENVNKEQLIKNKKDNKESSEPKEVKELKLYNEEELKKIKEAEKKVIDADEMNIMASIKYNVDDEDIRKFFEKTCNKKYTIETSHKAIVDFVLNSKATKKQLESFYKDWKKMDSEKMSKIFNLDKEKILKEFCI